LRAGIIEGLREAGSGHPGGSLSIAEILSVLYFHEMDVDPQNPNWADRDRFVLSKGHAAPALYAALANRGYFPEDDLKQLRKIGSHLQGHPDSKKTPGVDISSGSLGQGLSIACGMACHAKKENKNFRVYAVLGDGEIQEGQIWEAAMAAAHLKLDNLTAYLDNNNLQIDGPVDKIMSVYPIAEKFAAFGWHVLEADGNDVGALLSMTQKAKSIKDKPCLILCKTVKGKGVSFMENEVGWHGSAINEEQNQTAITEIRAELLKRGVEY
jgi:transketolase